MTKGHHLKKLSVALLLLSCAISTSAQAAPIAGAPAALELGIFAPNSNFTSGSAFTYITGLARHVQTVTGIPTTGRVWRNAGAFRRATGTMHFAVVDPVYLCRNRAYTVLASGQLGGGSQAPWGLFAGAGIRNLGDLRGKRLALAASGAGDAAFAEGMLGGRVKLQGFVGSIVYRSDLTSAINAVKSGAAEAVLAPVALATGLRRVFSTQSVPNAGLVVIKRGLPQTLVRQVSGAVMGYGAAGVGGWGGAAGYSCPSGRVQYPMATVPLRFVPPAQAAMIRKLDRGKGYQLAPFLDQYQVR